MPSGEKQKQRTRCPSGHPYSEANTYWQTKKSGGFSRCCRECQKLRMQRKRENPKYLSMQAENTRRWRERHPELNKQQYTANRLRKKEWLDSKKLSCVKCGEARTPCLEFHHRNPAEKNVNLSVAYMHWSIPHLEFELAKCDVICSNCHRMLHWEERQRRQGLKKKEEE